MIKVLILSRDPSWHGGVVNFVELLKSNFTPEVDVESFTIGRRKESGFRNRFMVPITDAFKLHRRIRSASYDVIHLNPSLNIPSLLRDGLFMLVLRLYGFRKVFVTWHGWDTDLAGRSTKGPIKVIFRSVFGLAQSMWVLASFFVSQMSGMGIPAGRIQQYTTMFDGNIFRGCRRSRSDEQIRLLFLSRFEREKGIYELLEAFHGVAQKDNKVHLIFAGDGPEMNSMREWVGKHKLEKRVTFTGYLRDEEKVQVLLDADIFVFPTYYGEGCPVSLLEAMAAGLPVITAPAGGIPDIFQDGENGFLLQKVCAASIAHAIMKLLGDAGLREQFGAYNRREAWEKYEAKVVTRRFEKHYLAMTTGNREEKS